MRENFSLARNWWMIPWSSSPQYCFLVKQADALQVQKIPTSHREWTFILGLQAPWARSIPQQHHTLCDNEVKIFYICLGLQTILFHWVEIHDLCIIFCCIQFLWTTKPIISKTFHSAPSPANPFFHNFISSTLFGIRYILLCSKEHYQL